MKIKESIIELKDLCFFARHGALEQEKLTGGNFRVNVSLKTNVGKEAFENDNLDATVNYAEVYEVIKNEMNIPSKLLEEVAYRTVKKLLEQFERIEEVEFLIEKLCPPIGAEVLSAAVRIKVTRNEI